MTDVTPTVTESGPASTPAPALAQHGHDVRLDWGEAGLAALGVDCAVVVVVDVLSFGTRVDLALAAGTSVRPVRWNDPMPASAPDGAEPLRSPNGATLTLEAATTGAHVLTACLRNADAVAKLAAELASGGPIGVLAAGEQWGVQVGAAAGSAGPLRPCLEDQLGAGAVVAGLQSYGDISPEAVVAAQAFAVADVPAAVYGSASGRELGAHGDAELLERAVEVGVSACVPGLGSDGVLAGA